MCGEMDLQNFKNQELVDFHKFVRKLNSDRGPGKERFIGHFSRYDDYEEDVGYLTGDYASTTTSSSTTHGGAMPSRYSHTPVPKQYRQEYIYPDDPIDQKLHGKHVDKKGKLVTFFRNGDPNYKGLTTSISQKIFMTFETLLMWLNEKISTTTGVRYVFGIPDGREIRDVSEFQGGRSYVVSSVKELNTKVVYGYSRENFWQNKRPSASKFRRGEPQALLRPSPVLPPEHIRGSHTPLTLKPRIFTIISNTHRDSREKVILNPQTAQSFEDLLKDFTNMLKLEYPPVSRIYTARPPFKKVQGYSQLFREFRDHDAFIACGNEERPFEAKNRGDSDDEPDTPRKPHRRDDDEDFDDINDSERSSQTQQQQQKPRHSDKGIKKPMTRTDAVVAAPRDDPTPPPKQQQPPPVVQQPPAPAPQQQQQQQQQRVHTPPYNNHHEPARTYQPPPLQTQNQEPPPYRQHSPNPDRYPLNHDRQAPQGPHPPSTGPPPPPLPHHQHNPYHPANNPQRLPIETPRQGAHRLPSRQPLHIDNRRYKGDQYNQPPATTNKAGDDRRFNVARVDIHGQRREFYAPTIPDGNDDGMRPDRMLSLDWVYGYRGKDARNNLHVLPTGELIYTVSAITVVYDKKRDRQRHYAEHNEEILCISIHDTQPYVATGQSAGKTSGNRAHVRIWDYRTLQTFNVIGEGVFMKGVGSVGFSHEMDGDYLLALDMSNKHVLTLWDWEAERLVAKTTTSSSAVTGAVFHPHDDTIIVTYGKQHISFWKVFWESDRGVDQSGRILRDKKSGIFDDEVPKFITSLTFSSNGDVITGDSTGSIIIWNKDPMDAFIKDNMLSYDLKHAHQKTVLVLTMLPDGTLLSGGGNEIRAWDSVNQYKIVKERMIPDSYGYPRTIVGANYEGTDGLLYIGTTRNCVLEGSLQEKFNTVIQGHYDELWAQTTHPAEHCFYTAGYDMQVIKWSTLNHKIIWRTTVDRPCLSVAIDSNGQLIAVGTTAGRLVLLDATNGQHIASLQVTNERELQLGVVSFSPAGNYLAVGSHDTDIYIFTILDDGQCIRRVQTGKLQGHRNFLTQIDWSSDGHYLQSMSGDYDLKYWNADMMQREKNSTKFCDTDWFTQTCTLGFCTLGAWSNLDKGDDINCVSRSNFRDILAVGENRGRIRLYKYPCSTHRADYTEVKAYTNHITTVRFMFDDSFLISTGGMDDAIMQWALIETKRS
ncbi:77 kDa echinoderm microtubule-associated protein-like isoform X2 [Tubulanus polymorphus]|uniref:77 kDa echinoderm microtubule-associated protein-like isoform X2 n=1 Tax=Tubulanus polymorphus TaxID=672921 RepID=UPI003DA613DB